MTSPEQREDRIRFLRTIIKWKQNDINFYERVIREANISKLEANIKLQEYLIELGELYEQPN